MLSVCFQFHISIYFILFFFLLFFYLFYNGSAKLIATQVRFSASESLWQTIKKMHAEFLYSRLQSHWTHYQLFQLFKTVRFFFSMIKKNSFHFCAAQRVAIELAIMVPLRWILESVWVKQKIYAAWMGIKIKLLLTGNDSMSSGKFSQEKLKPELSNISSNERN